MEFVLRVVFTQKASGVKDYDVIDSIRNVKNKCINQFQSKLSLFKTSFSFFL